MYYNSDLNPTTKIHVGRNLETGNRVRLSPERRSTHTHVIGSPGGGKSKLLEHLIRKDARAGHGICLIDPHGTTYRNVLRWIVGSRIHERRDIYILDPTRFEWSVGFNPLAFSADNLSQVDYAISSVVDAITTAFGSQNTDRTPLLERVLTVGLYVAFFNDLTLAELPNILSAVDVDETRSRLTTNIGDWYIQQQCEELYGLNKRQFRESVGSSLNRLSRLLTSPVVRRMVGQQEQAIDLHKIIKEGDILLVNLGAGDRALTPARQRLIGSLLVNDLFLSGQMRPEDSRPFYLYIDECHRFLTKDIEAILVESRKRGLHATLAHQNLGQLEDAGDSIYSAVMSSAQTKVVFGMEDIDEAKVIAKNVFAHPDDIDLQETKDSIITYQTTGHEVVWLENESEARSHGITEGTSRKNTVGKTQSRQESVTDSESTTRTEGEGTHHGEGKSAGEGISELEDGTIVVYETEGTNTTDGRSSFSAVANSTSRAVTHGKSTTQSMQRSRGKSKSHSRSKSRSRGRSEAIVPKVEETRTNTYTLEEHLYRRARQIKNLPTAQAILKVPARKSIQLQVPYVGEGYARPEQIRQFVEHRFAGQPSAMRAGKAAERIEARQRKLITEGMIQEEPDEWQ